MDELREQAKGYILIEEISIFQNEVYQARQKLDKRKANTKADLHKSDKRHKPNKRQPLSKGPRYKHYTPLTTNHTTILEEVFNLDVPIRLPKTKLPRSGSDITKYCKYHHGIDHSTEDCLALKDKIEELIQVGYVAQFFKRLENHQAGARPGGHQEEQHKNQEANRRRVEDRGRQRPQPQRHERPPSPKQEPTQHIRCVINIIAGRFFYGGQSNQSRKCHLHVIRDININFVNTPLQ